MSPTTTPGGGEAQRARGAARRQAPALARALPVLGAMALSALLVGALLVLDYTFDQDPHRIFKVSLGIAGLGFVLLNPKIGLLLLPVVAPFLPWIPPTPVPGLNPLNILLFAIFGTYATSRIVRRLPLVPENHLGKVLGLLMLVIAVSVVRGAAFPTGYGFDAALGATTVFRAGTTFATYFIVMAMAHGPEERRRVWWAVMVGLLVESIVTIAYGRNGRGGRAIGSIGQSNDLGAFLALFAVPALAGVFGVKNGFGKAVLLTIFVLASIGVMMSLSRGSMVALLAGVFVVAWMSSRWAFGLLVVAMLFSPLWAPDYVKERVQSSSMEVEGTDEVTVDMASEARLQTWQSILEVVKDHPIEGVGFTGLAYVLPEIGEGLGLEEVKDSAHNTWLRMLAETGLIGLTLFVWLMWKAWMLGYKAARRARDAFDHALGIGLCGAVVTLAVNCAFGDRFFNVVIASSFWMLCALAEVAIGESRAREEEA
ncbi:MAG: O-antigen ligase family protein [Candidatus Eisenbacteria bacterium]|nr:O-antigen ligase family protein [Candidatus Eisenbacteria bacterium]